MRVIVARLPEPTSESTADVARRAKAKRDPDATRVAREVGPSKANPIPIGIAYRDEICHAAEHHGIDPLLLAAQAAQESGGPGTNSGRNIVQVGGRGHGVFQIDPAGGYGDWLKAHHDGLSVVENVEKAATIDAGNLRKYGSTHAMLTAFNAGHDADAASSVTTWPDGRKVHYAASVERHLAAIMQLVEKHGR